MSQTLSRYARGEVVTSMDWVGNEEAIEDAWILHDDLIAERATAQGGLFNNEIYYQKLPQYVTIELTPEQEHLLRPSEKPKNVLPFTTSYNQLPEQEKLAVVREQLQMQINQ